MTEERAKAFVVDCRTCGYHEEYDIAQLASDDERDHRARTSMPRRARHDVVAMPRETWERGQAEAAAQRVASEIASRPVHLMPTQGAFASHRAFYEGLGFRVTPVYAPCSRCRAEPRTAHKCLACGGGKKPLLSGWQQGGALRHDANVGIVTGVASGHLTVLDFDTNDGLQRLLRRSAEDLAGVTVVVRTSRGHHLYLRHPGFGRGREVMGILVRADGGLVVAPPSMHATGVRYEFVLGRAIGEHLVARAVDVLPAEFYRAFSTPPVVSVVGNTDATTTQQHRQHQPAAPAAARASVPGGAGTAYAGPLVPVDLAIVQRLAAQQRGTFAAHWAVVNGAPSTDRSKTDWVVALMLAENGYEPGQIAWVLLQLPGSKARDPEREVAWREGYARLTATKAWESKRPAGKVAAT